MCSTQQVFLILHGYYFPQKPCRCESMIWKMTNRAIPVRLPNCARVARSRTCCSATNLTGRTTHCLLPGLLGILRTPPCSWLPATLPPGCRRPEPLFCKRRFSSMNIWKGDGLYLTRAQPVTGDDGNSVINSNPVLNTLGEALPSLLLSAMRHIVFEPFTY